MQPRHLRTSLIAIPLLALALALAAPAAGTHLVGLPHCDATLAAAAPVQYDAGRLRTEGYGSGSIAGVNLGLVDAVSPSPVPNVFRPQQPAPVAQEIHVAGALVSLQFAALQNQFLLGGAPTTEVRESAFPLDLATTKAHSGAQNLLAIFTGRVVVYAAETFSCESVVHANTVWTFTVPKIALDGWATTTTVDDTVAEPWGTGVEIDISAGETRDW